MYSLISRLMLLLLGIFLIFPAFSQRSHAFFKTLDSESGISSMIKKSGIGVSPTKVQHNTATGGVRPEVTESRLIAMVYKEGDESGLEVDDSVRLYWADGIGDEDLAESGVAENQFYPGYSFFFSSPEFLPRVDSMHFFEDEEAAFDFKLLSVKDAEGRITSHNFQDLVGDEWEDEYRYEYQYNSNGQIFGVTYSYYSNDEWIEEQQTTYDYDGKGRLIEVIEYNMGIDYFIPDEKYLNGYDEDGHIVTQYMFSWNRDIGEWDELERRRADYDNGRLIREYTESWNSGTGGYEIDDVMLFLYDKDGKYVGFEYYADESDLIGVMEFKYTGSTISEILIYDADGLDSLELSARVLLSHNTYDQLTRYKSENWDEEEDDWGLYTEVYDFYYEEYETTSLEHIETTLAQANFNVFPNPANEMVTVSSAENNIDIVRIYDQQAKLVYMTETTSHTREMKISIGELNSGIYFLEIQSGNKKGIKQLVVQ